ncbi:MAG: Smr/MutS family protein [Mariprofundaceae bacterium]|nr:Smr/MutS family protein [Mariprofundaceae bacterium]
MGDSDEDLFAQAMKGVRPQKIDDSLKINTTPPAPKVYELSIQTPKKNRQMKHMSSPQEDGDWMLRSNGIADDVLKKLGMGRPAVDRCIDLHGMTRDDGLINLEEACHDMIADKQRVLRVIHGRGLHSPDGRSVMKHAVYDALRCSALSGYVLAVIPCPKSRGGACLILLRRAKNERYSH